MEVIKINVSNLILINENYDCVTIISCNRSGLYACLDKNNERVYLTRAEVKRMSTINEVDRTLELLNSKKWNKVYTNDGLNFIDEYEFVNDVPDDEKEEFHRVDFKIDLAL